MVQHRQTEAPGVTDLVGRLVDSLGQLIAQHVALARLELSEEARSMGRALGTLALFIPLLVVGYALLCLALALALGHFLPLAWAVCAVGGANLLAGALGLLSVGRALKGPHLQETSRAVRETTQVLGAEATKEASRVH